MTMADQAPSTTAPAKKATAAPAGARKSTHVVMTSSTYDASNGDVVAVTSEQSERLIVNGHARAVRPGEVKAAEAK